MEYVIQGYRPKRLFEFFEEVSAIPRGSKNEKGISDYLLHFAAVRGLRAYRDEMFNVIIWKDGQCGGEKCAPLLLECHTDIVCAKDPDVEHDFLHDPIRLVQDGNILHAGGTTLGADNGCGVAILLYLLESDDLPHPPLECFFAAQEELGCLGAAYVDVNQFKARRAIGLDAGTDGVLCKGTSSKYTYILHHEVSWQAVQTPTWTLQICGLNGGHAALWMPMGRQNAARLAGIILNALRKDAPIQLCEMHGEDSGVMSECSIKFTTAMQESLLHEEIKHLQSQLQREFAAVEPGLYLELSKQEPGVSLDVNCSDALIDWLLFLPYGVYSRNQDAPALVDSYANLTKVHLVREAEFAEFGVVFSVELPEKAERLYELMQRCLDLFGGEIISESLSQGWMPSEQSPIRDIMVEAFVQLYGKKPFVKVSHGGNDCVELVKRIPGLDVVTCAADCINHHTPREFLPLDTFERVWALVTETLNLLVQKGE